MSIIDSIRMSQRRQTMLASGAAVSLLAPTAVAGLVVSIGDVLRGDNKQVIIHKRLLNSSFKKIKRAVMVANRDRTVPKLALEAEESDAIDVLMQAVKSGVGTAIETLCEGLFSFIPFAIETVVIPMFTIAMTTVATVLPILLTPEGLLAVGAIAAGVFFYKRWKAWSEGKTEGEYTPVEPKTVSLAPSNAAPAPEAAAESPMTGATVGFRNNNPGNLRYAQQPGALPQNGAFAQFATQGQGLYNMGRQIELNYSRGKDTVKSMVETWAPRNENQTDDYIAAVSKRMGVTSEAKLNLLDVDTLGSLMKAIIMQENGSNPYSDAQIKAAAQQALGFAANGYKDPEVTAAAGAIRLVYPTTGTVSSPFGHREKPIEGASTEHAGVDIAGPVGTAVVAAADGTVESEYKSASYGNFIQLKHDGFRTRYGHLSAFSVQQGQTVVAGQKIGEMGSTGVSTGAHLHFEVQPVTAQSPVDPATYLPGLDRGQRMAATEVKTVPVASASDEKVFVNRPDGAGPIALKT